MYITKACLLQDTISISHSPGGELKTATVVTEPCQANFLYIAFSSLVLDMIEFTSLRYHEIHSAWEHTNIPRFPMPRAFSLQWSACLAFFSLVLDMKDFTSLR